MTCYVCENGEFEAKKVDKALTRNGKVILFTGVPAEVCDICGERMFNPDVVDITLKYANDFFAGNEKTHIISYEALEKIPA